jgi:tetratricopeptide (TPR) repeat protein
MSFWRDEVIGFALDHETRLHIEEQRELIAREPENPKPYYALAQFYRMGGKTEEARVLLEEALRKDAGFGPAHASLCEMHAISGDYPAAWRHARAAEVAGDAAGVELLRRYGVAE